MRFGSAIFGCRACAVLLALSCGTVASNLWGQGMQRSTRSAASSETNSLEIFSTLKGLDAKDDGLKRRDEELAKSLQPFMNPQSVPAAVSSTYQMPRLPASKTRRPKEEVEKSKGWIWDAEEAVSGRSEEEKSLFPGFNENSGSDKKKSSWDQYYKDAKPQRQSNPGFRSRYESEAQRKSDSDDDTEIGGGIGAAAKKLKARLETESVGSIFRPSSQGSVADFFGQSVVSAPTAAQIQAHKNYMDEYQKIIGGAVVNPANSDFFGAAASSALQGNHQGLDALPTVPRNEGLAFTSGATPSAPARATLPDANANLLNQWNPLYTPPKLELPKPAPFFPPPMDFPRRKF
jgi:hypothetical protein